MYNKFIYKIVAYIYVIIKKYNNFNVFKITIKVHIFLLFL